MSKEEDFKEKDFREAEKCGIPRWSAQSILDAYGRPGLEEVIADLEACREDEELQGLSISRDEEELQGLNLGRILRTTTDREYNGLKN